MTYNTIPITSGAAKFSTLDPDGNLFIQEQDITRGADEDNQTTLYSNAANKFYAEAYPPTGTVLIYGGSSAPEGFLICNGAAISRTDYSTLFQIIGTTYGAGNGTTTFNLPDLSGRVVIGVSGTHAIGTKGGAETVTLTTQQIPSHSHTLQASNSSASTSLWASQAMHPNAYVSLALPTGNTGGGQAHNNMQPYQTLNYIIKT